MSDATPGFSVRPLPRQAADEIVLSFEEARRMARPVSRVFAKVESALGARRDASDEAVHRASVALARAIDDQHDFFDRHAYHNRQHFCEVLLSALFLCRLHRLPVRAARRVLLAALAHDLEHDGVPGAAFVYERRSVARCAPYLARAGVDERDYQAVAALVLSTDVRHGMPVAVRILRWHDAGGAGVPVDVPVPEMRALRDDASLARAAVLLCEADVLPSVGLTLSHALRLQDRLSREWGTPLQPADKLRFLDTIEAAGVIGDFFMPNLQALRQSLGDSAHAA